MGRQKAIGFDGCGRPTISDVVGGGNVLAGESRRTRNALGGSRVYPRVDWSEEGVNGVPESIRIPQRRTGDGGIGGGGYGSRSGVLSGSFIAGAQS
jgi:hypothetical protein